MNMGRRLARLEGQIPPRVPGQIQLLDLCGLSTGERERRIAEARARRGDWRPGDPLWTIEIVAGDDAEDGAA